MYGLCVCVVCCCVGVRKRKVWRSDFKRNDCLKKILSEFKPSALLVSIFLSFPCLVQRFNLPGLGLAHFILRRKSVLDPSLSYCLYAFTHTQTQRKYSCLLYNKKMDMLMHTFRHHEDNLHKGVKVSNLLYREGVLSHNSLHTLTHMMVYSHLQPIIEGYLMKVSRSRSHHCDILSSLFPCLEMNLAHTH